MLYLLLWPFALVGLGFTLWQSLRLAKAGWRLFRAWLSWREEWGREIALIRFEEVWVSPALLDFATRYSWTGVGYKALREELAKAGLSDERMRITYKVVPNIGKPWPADGDYGSQQDSEIDFFIKGLEVASGYAGHSWAIDRSHAVVKITEEEGIRLAS